MNELIAGKITQLLVTVTVSQLKAMCRKALKPQIFESALNGTQLAHPKLESGPALRQWCESDQFGDLLTTVQKQGQSHPNGAIVRSFIEVGNFYHAEQTESAAEELLNTFFRLLEAEVLRSPDAIVALAGLQRNLSAEGIQAIERAESGILAVVNDRSERLEALIQDSSIRPQAIQEHKFHARIDDARELLRSAYPKAAFDRLTAIRQEVTSSNPSQSILFRIATNLGCCALHLGDEPRAIEELTFAYKLEPENPKAIVNASLVALLKREPDEALRLAEIGRERTPHDSIATAHYIRALFALQRDAEAMALRDAEPWIREDSDCCRMIGTCLLQQHRFSEAEPYLRTALARKPDSVPAAMNLAQVLMHPTDAHMIGETFLSWRLPAGFVSRLKEALSLLDGLIGMHTDDRRNHGICLSFRANVRRMLGEEGSAIEDCKLALTYVPNDSFALQIMGLSYLRADNYGESIKSFEAVSDERTKLQCSVPLATAYMHAGKPELTVPILEAWVASSSDPETLLDTADLLLCAYEKLGQAELAQRLIERLRKEWSEHPTALSAIGRHLNRRGETDEAIRLLTEALVNADGPVRDFIALNLAEYYYAASQFAKAVDLYGSVADLERDDAVTRCYLVCLYKTGMHREALRLAQRIRNGGTPAAVVGEIEAELLLKIGDLPEAQALFEGLSNQMPDRPTHRLNAVMCAMRRGKTEVAQRLLSEVQFENIRQDGGALIEVAKLRAHLGMKEVLRFAYQARRMAYDDPEVHAAYVGLFLRRERDGEIPSPVTVGCDCTVRLDTVPTYTHYAILDEVEVYSARGELSIDQAGQLGLLGKKVGESVTLGKMAEVTCSVIEIQHKYVHGFQETLLMFPKLFPTKPLIEPMKGTPEELKEFMFRRIDEQDSNFRHALKFYESGQISAEQLGAITGQSLFSIWGLLIGGNYCKFRASGGSEEDKRAEAKAVEGAQSVVLDLTAFLTLAKLGRLNEVRDRFPVLLTTQAVLDALHDEIDDNPAAGPTTILAKRGDRYIADEVTPDRIAARHQFITTVLDFITSSVNVVPVHTLLEENAPHIPILRRAFGPVAMSCALAANEKSIMLWSDDVTLRAWAHVNLGIPVAWTQSVLLDIVTAGKLSLEDYNEAVANLVLMNYRFVSIDHAAVFLVFVRNNFRINDEAKLVLGELKGPDCTLESAANVLSQVVKLVWVEQLLHETKLEVLDAILEVIIEGRSLKQSVSLLLSFIKERFFLLPLAWEHIEQYCKRWTKLKMSRSGLVLREWP
jgi:tetratricopeptide (TPR) repeat protein